MKGVGGKMRSDNNKPWGTHSTVEIPPAQLEPRGVELLWKKKKSQKKPSQNPRGSTHRQRHSNSLALAPPLCARSPGAALSPARLTDQERTLSHAGTHLQHLPHLSVLPGQLSKRQMLRLELLPRSTVKSQGVPTTASKRSGMEPNSTAKLGIFFSSYLQKKLQ